MPGGVVPPLELVLQWQTDAFPHGIRAPPTLTIISVVFTALSLAIVVSRFYDRFIIRHNAGLDDALIAVALIPHIALCVATCLAEQLYGFDRHAWDITPQMGPLSRKITLAISLLYIGSTTLTKLSILLFYRRLGKIRQWFKWTIWANMAFLIGYAICFIITIPLECSPVNAYWNKVNPMWAMKHDYSCINEGAGNVANGAISAVQDFIACILPMAIFWDLRISKRAKLALGFVFSLGLITCICGILRTIELHRIFFKTYDTTWNARWPFALTVVESSLGLICASIPALKGSLSRLFSSFIKPIRSANRNSKLYGGRRWTNPFFASMKRNSQMYNFNWSGETPTDSHRSRNAEGGVAAPQNTYVKYDDDEDNENDAHPRADSAPQTPNTAGGSEFELAPQNKMEV
ncbi:putative integral membrane protein [Diplodia seriata]|uniref:Putative integral membrane protein n=1 Tax=Diplodia seriata TaxID=420778 RepID=A0A0G2DY64_9PEZI|nr:putative integral membrane protein [Diplodia seriata]